MAIKQMDADELKDVLNSEDVFLVDVREQDEWDAGHIPQAIFIPLSTLEDNLDKFPEDKNTRIILQCRSGKRSMNAAYILEENGYTDLTNFSGGILEWIDNGYPTVRD